MEKGWKRTSLVVTFLFLATAIFLWVAYAGRPDWATAVTIFPAWVWVVLGIPLILFLHRPWRKYGGVLLVVFLLLFADETVALLRTFWSENAEYDFRVVTVNAAGQMEAVEAVMVTDPDLVLIQESPPHHLLRELAQRSQLASVLGPDTSILAKSELRPIASGSYWVAALWKWRSYVYEVVSLRLPVTRPRVDLWNPACWAAQWRTRIDQRQSLERVLEEIGEGEVILGGDFNVPPGDGIFARLAQLRDSFRQGGRGWGATILANYPLLRIDQIWISQQLRCTSGYTIKAGPSDHLAYVANFIVTPPPSRER